MLNEIQISLENHQISMKNGAKIGPGTASGAKRAQGGKKVPKMVWIWSGFESFLAPFCHLEALFWKSFFVVFLEGNFFSPWAFFGAQGAQKAAKMEQFWSLFEDGWDSENVCFIIVKPYFWRSREVPGANFFQTAVLECLRRGPGDHFCRFCAFLGPLWDPWGLHLGPKRVLN